MKILLRILDSELHTTRSPKRRLSSSLILSLMLLAGFIGVPPATAAATQAPNLEDYRDRVFTVADHYEETDLELSVLTESLDFEPLNAFRFVRDEIALHPYHGVLRGQQGVLAVRAGNALERATLLANLIQDMGLDARLVLGELSADRQRELDRGVIARRAPVDYEALASIAGLGPDVQKAIAQRAASDFEKIAQLALPNLIAEDQSSKPSGMPHVWVQAQLEGKWMDLDPAFPKARPGEAFGSVTGYDSNHEAQAGHEVTIKVIAETLVNGKFSESTLLSKTLDASVAARQQILLWFVPQPANASALALRKLVAPGEGFLPVISVDSKVSTGKATKPIVTASHETSAAESFFASDGVDVVSGMYLELTVQSPNENPVTKRRVLLDRMQADQRRNPSKQSQLLPLAKGFEQPSVFEAIHQIAIVTGGVGPFELASTLGVSMAFANMHFRDKSSFSELTLTDTWWPIGNANLTWLNAGEHIVLDQLNGSDSNFYFVGRPKVALMSVVPTMIDDQFVLASEIDFLHDNISAVAKPGGEPRSTSAGRMRYGILRSALETEAGVEKAKHMDMQDGRLISASLQLSPPLKVVKGAGDVTPQTPAALARDVGAGAIVIINQELPTDTWWSIDPDNGNTSARLAPGLGGQKIMGRKIYHGGGNFGGSSGGRTYVIDVKTMNVIEEYDSKGRKVRKSMNKPAKHKPKKSGTNEYLTVLEYVSIPTGWHVGLAQGMFVAEIAIIVLLNIATMS